MFSDDQGVSHHSRVKYCVVATDEKCLRKLLSVANIPAELAHVLWCGSDQPPAGFKSSTSLLSAIIPAAFQVPSLFQDCPSLRTDQVRLALEQLHTRYSFTHILFPVLGGLGFRSIQAALTGLAFENVSLLVYLHTTSADLRAREGRRPDSPADLLLDYLERYCFENADSRIVDNDEIVPSVLSRGWHFESAFSTSPQKLPSAHSARMGLDLSMAPLVTICVPHYNLGACLPATLQSLATQTYSTLEVIVVDDGSTDPFACRVVREMQEHYPHFRFIYQANAGIGATRNLGLQLAQGDYFIPIDADNIARPDMVEKLLRGIHARSELAALTCYFLAFADDNSLQQGRFLHAYRPTGGPFVLSCLRNVYGDGTAIYRTQALRAVGGYETDRHSSFEDWEVFVKLTRSGYRVDVLPEHLFYYRFLQTGFSRTTSPYLNHERVLRQFRALDALPLVEQYLLWDALAGFHQMLIRYAAERQSLRYRVADRVHALLLRIPLAIKLLNMLLCSFRSR